MEGRAAWAEGHLRRGTLGSQRKVPVPWEPPGRRPRALSPPAAALPCAFMQVEMPRVRRQPRETGSVDGGRVCALRHPSTRRRPRRPALGASARPRHSGPPRRSQAPRHHATSRRRAPRPRTEVAGPGRTSDQTEGRAPCSNTGPQPRKGGPPLNRAPGRPRTATPRLGALALLSNPSCGPGWAPLASCHTHSHSEQMAPRRLCRWKFFHDQNSRTFWVTHLQVKNQKGSLHRISFLHVEFIVDEEETQASHPVNNHGPATG